MKYQATVEAARLGAAMELGGRRGEAGDYLIACEDGPGVLFLRAATFDLLFRPVNGGAPAKAAREPKTDEEPGRRGTMKALVLRALGEGPKIAGELADWVRKHGVPAYTVTKASAVLTYMAKRGQVQVGKDHLWRVKG